MGKTLIVPLIAITFFSIFLKSGYPQKTTVKKSTPIGEMTMHVVPQSHIDLAWWWRYDPQTIHVIVKNTLETAFKNMEKYPDYTFTFLQVPAIEPMEEYYPDIFYKMRYYSHDKRILGERLRNPLASDEGGRFTIASGLLYDMRYAMLGFFFYIFINILRQLVSFLF
jgi:hypothetical protein